ncbi:MAG: hypothetical protein Q8920_12340 [Bacillota bacterium]|nr:hypothetical protein [Bacillota bacterium]
MRNFKTKLGLLAAAVLAVCVISFGCSINLSLSNSTGTMKGSFSSAKTNTQTHEINLKKGETVSFKYDFKVKEGEIYAELESPSGKAAAHFSP